MLLVVWWAWNYTTWVTNELDPDSPVVRLLLIGIMLATLLMAVAIPGCVRVEGAPLRLLVRRHPGRPPRVPHLRVRAAGTIEREASRPTSSSGSPPPACSGSRVRSSRTRRAALWLVALGIDYLAPSSSIAYRAGRSSAPRRGTSRRHFAERFQLFVIIALGESIVVTGATTQGSTSSRPADRARSRIRRNRSALVAVLRLRGADRATAARARPTGRCWRGTATRTSTRC